MDEEWHAGFEAFIDSLELRHFKASEFLIGLERGNYLPPAYLYSNIALTAVLVDNMRHRFGRPATITSAYRSPIYNRSEDGVDLSQHLAFTALDVSVSRVPTRKVAEWFREQRGKLVRIPITVRRISYVSPAGAVPFAKLETWLLVDGQASLVRPALGIGTYDTFCHVDSRGLNHSWSGSG